MKNKNKFIAIITIVIMSIISFGIYAHEDLKTTPTPQGSESEKPGCNWFCTHE